MQKTGMNNADIVGLKKDIGFLVQTVNEMKQDLKDMRVNYMTKEQVTSLIQEVYKDVDEREKSKEERLKRVEVIIYGMIGLILTGFLGALIALVFKK